MSGKKKTNSKKIIEEQMTPVKRDIILVLIILVAALLFISNLGFLGPIGYGLSFLMFGLFGLPAYVLPIVGAYLALFMFANMNDKLYMKRMIGISGFYILVCALCQLIMTGYDPTYLVFQAFLDSSANHMGGGFLGCCISQLLGFLVGVIGAYIIIIIGMVIFAIIITQKPLVSSMKDRTKDAYDKHRENLKRKKELQKAEKQRNSLDNDILNPEKLTTAKRKNLLYDTKLDKKEKDTVKFELPELDITPEFFDNIEETSENVEDTNIIESLPTENESYDGQGAEIIIENSDEDFEPEYTEKAVNDDLVEISRVSADMGISENHTGKDVLLDDKEAHKINSQKTKEINIENKGSAPKISADSAVKTAKKVYKKPPITLLNKGNTGNSKERTSHVRETALKLQQTLHNFGVEAKVVNASCGPTVTRYELQPEQGVKVSKIVNLADDIKLNLAAADIRIEAPIPGKAAVGIEVPNKTNHTVALRELIDTPEFKNSKSTLSITVGKDLSGKPVISDIAKMPHLLIAGSTGSGKSVCINTFIMSILYKATPDEVKMMLIDPKVVELSIYNGIPHLLSPVVTDPKKAAGALQWAVQEMIRRYNLFAEFSVRDLKGYNAKAAEIAPAANENETKPEILPQIVIVVDELADLMMAAPGEVEDAICRLAQLARAAGIHLIIATQRPSVNVITGLIKANMPSRIALSVTSGIDSRVIIDMNGAEKLLGRGDMLFYPAGYQKPARIQGGFVSDEEIERVVNFLKNNEEDVVYDSSIEEAINNSAVVASSSSQTASSDDRDLYFKQAGKFIIEKDKASIGMLQRVFKIGFNRAARIMDQLCEAGVVGEEEGTKPRKILMTLEQFENYIEEN